MITGVTVCGCPVFLFPTDNFLPTVIHQKGYSSFFLAKIAFCPVMRKAAFTGLVGREKIILAGGSGIFSRQALPPTGQKPDRGK
ncbi:hypothetical protein QUW14_09145 [Bacteroides gallinaceum]|uniref:hypothetical protein n=1 Tax=Bacteroides gallinaceum TaxID=1462571 RepID=UPI0025A3F9C0|nr:hypothetical protein [Bacteroides gallinaceum]MDM8154474.1 hypothetical protein [Bacteroides gallinaceum]